MTTVTIGIPAYNEAANIRDILISLLNQSETFFKVTKIIVSSDGSTDETSKIVEGLKSRKIYIINNRERRGMARGQNQIIKNTSTDVLILINADTLIDDSHFIHNLIKPITFNGYDLVSARVKPLTSRNFFESIINAGFGLKTCLYEQLNNGNNVYTCNGIIKVFSKKLYKSLYYINSIGEDAYTYIYCVSRKFKYKYVTDSEVKFRSPNTLSDHKLQSTRFLKSKGYLIEDFGEIQVKKVYKIPFILYVKVGIKYFLKHPSSIYLCLMYILVFGSNYLLSRLSTSPSQMWPISKSSKILSRTSYEK